MARKLIVEIVGDSRSYERALKKSSNATNQFGQAMGATSPKVAKLNSVMGAAGFGAVGLAGAAGGLAVVLGGKSVQAASDLNEQISRTQVVLGQAADETIKWSETTATSMGISQRAALAAAGTFAGLFQTVGVQRNQAAELSRSLVQLAADLASLQNSSPEEALIALRSGLAGEAEPLRRFNIFLTEARVAQQALTETGKDNIRSLTQQEKTLARYSLILKDSTLAQGNFALTSDQLANQQRILRAQVDDLSTSFGQVLVPALTAVVGAINDAIQVGEDFKGMLEALAALPGIEIPVKLVGQVTEGRGGDILRHIVLGSVSPLALGITIGKEVADGIRQGAEGAAAGFAIPARPEEGVGAREAAEAQAAEDFAKAERDRANAIIERITRQGTAQKSLNQQLAESEQRATHLKDLIRADPDNAKLQQRLTAEYEKQNSLRAQQVSLGKQNAATAKANAAAAKAEAEAIAEARREREKAARIARRAAVQAGQFKALGLTETGAERTPGVEALAARRKNLLQQIKGTTLDTSKTRGILRRIGKVLRGDFGKVGKDVRDAILGMFNDISSALDQGDKKVGPLTKQSGLNTKKILEGMGLSPEEERELRGRLSSLGAGGQGLARPGGGTATTAARGFGGGLGQALVVESHTTINLDGQRVANVVTKQQQRGRRRNPQQKRGPHRHGI